MSRLVLMLEEYSMKVLLDALLRRLHPNLPFLCVPHEGKQDLEQSLSRKLRAWREPGVQFLVVRDNDGSDCAALKRRLLALCSAAGRSDTVIRIACEELEAWYLGDPEALADAYGRGVIRELGKARFRDPDSVQQPAAALLDLAPSFQKVSGARLLAPRLSPARNRSRSFQTFLSSVRRIATSLAGDQPN